MSDFNPDQFIATEFEGELDTIEPELPKGEYPAIIEAVDPKAVQPKDGGAELALLIVKWRLEGPTVEQIFGTEDGVLADQKIWLRTTDGTATGPLDRKHNQQLARLLVGLGLHGKPWQPAMLIGRQATVTARSEDGTDDWEGRRFYRVSGVAGR